MKREAKQELRRVLMGRTLIAEDGRLIAMEKGATRLPMGIGDGAVGTCFFGICRKARRLKVTSSEEKAKILAFDVMKDVGRGLYLPEQPEAVACLIRYVLSRPAVLVFDYVEGEPVLTAWAGRGITAWISLRRALNGFIKKMPKQMKVSDEKAPEDKVEKKQKKEKKKKEKKNRKNRRERKRLDLSDALAEAPVTMEENKNESESGSD